MKKVAWCVLVGALALVAGGPSAAGTFGFGVTGGAAIPMGDFGDAFDTGFGAGGYAEYWFNDQGAVGVDVGFSGHGAKDEFNDALNALTEALLLASGATTAESDLEIKSSFLQAGLHAKWAPPTGGTVGTYVQGGVALYNLRVRIEGPVTADGFTVDIDEDDTESDFGLNLGAGVLFHASPVVSLGVAGTFHNVFTEEESTQYFTVGAQVHFAAGAR